MRAKTVQGVLSRVVPLHKVVAHVVAVQEALAHVVDGWEMFLAVATTMREMIASADQGGRGVHIHHQGPCTPSPPQILRTATRATCVTKRAA